MATDPHTVTSGRREGRMSAPARAGTGAHASARVAQVADSGTMSPTSPSRRRYTTFTSPESASR